MLSTLSKYFIWSLLSSIFIEIGCPQNNNDLLFWKCFFSRLDYGLDQSIYWFSWFTCVQLWPICVQIPSSNFFTVFLLHFFGFICLFIAGSNRVNPLSPFCRNIIICYLNLKVCFFSSKMPWDFQDTTKKKFQIALD